MPRVFNNREANISKDAVYVGRPTKWGNPYIVGRDGTRNQCVAFYENYIENKIFLDTNVLVELKRELKGKDLICWCAPESCHADVLMRIANE